MVFFYRSDVVNPPVVLFMGKNKEENENLIKWGFPEDVCFHVDNLSSAHVFLRLAKDQSIDDIPQAVITDACQLVKANSIKANKRNDVDVVYTGWSNLQKSADMAAGQVAYFSQKSVKKVRVERRNHAIINRLNKTKEERHPDLQAERESRNQQERLQKKQELKMLGILHEEQGKQCEAKKNLCSCHVLMRTKKMTTNRGDGNNSDKFI